MCARMAKKNILLKYKQMSYLKITDNKIQVKDTEATRVVLDPNAFQVDISGVAGHVINASASTITFGNYS